MKNLWSLPVLSVYFYAVTILTQHGYNSYFGIPSNFIEASLKENIINFFQLFQIAFGIAGLISWWMWVVVALSIAIVLYLSNFKYKAVISSVLFAILGALSWSSYAFGGWVGANITSFYSAPSKCISMGEDKVYIIPSFYDGKAIIVPIDQTNKIIEEGFLIRNISELPCGLKQKEVGKIVR